MSVSTKNTCLLCVLLLVAQGLRAEDLHDALARVLKKENVPAAAVVIVEPELKTRFLLFGEGVTSATSFRWGSVTKTFTALTLMKAAEASGVSLDSRLSDIVNEKPWHNPFPDAPIRLLHLLEMTAGMPDLSRRAFGDNRDLSLPVAVTEHADSLRVEWQPGRFHSYTNASAGLSQLAIEALTGQTYARALRESVLNPLGMASASVRPDANLPGGFRADGVTSIPYWNMTFAAFGALNASSEDLSQLLLALLAHGEVSGRRAWSRKIDDHLWRPHTGLAAEAGLEVGYAAGIYGRVRRSRIWYGHGGDADGYRSRYAVEPAAGVGYAVVINTDNPAALRRLEGMLERHLAPALPPLPDGKLSRPPKFSGVLYPAVARFDVTGWRMGDHTRRELSWQDSRLTFAGRELFATRQPGLYRRNGDPVATVALLFEDGKAVLVGEMGAYRGMASNPRR